mmetsp:Transcript_98495/g.294134  ORF Transcript_98495/g.294134 Transcript_98495/m.294134 type:complete len:290 (-) Transcript_98495:9-878(-)
MCAGHASLSAGSSVLVRASALAVDAQVGTEAVEKGFDRSTIRRGWRAGARWRGLRRVNGDDQRHPAVLAAGAGTGLVAADLHAVARVAHRRRELEAASARAPGARIAGRRPRRRGMGWQWRCHRGVGEAVALGLQQGCRRACAAWRRRHRRPACCRSQRCPSEDLVKLRIQVEVVSGGFCCLWLGIGTWWSTRRRRGGARRLRLFRLRRCTAGRGRDRRAVGVGPFLCRADGGGSGAEGVEAVHVQPGALTEDRVLQHLPRQRPAPGVHRQDLANASLRLLGSTGYDPL